LVRSGLSHPPSSPYLWRYLARITEKPAPAASFANTWSRRKRSKDRRQRQENLLEPMAAAKSKSSVLIRFAYWSTRLFFASSGPYVLKFDRCRLLSSKEPARSICLHATEEKRGPASALPAGRGGSDELKPNSEGFSCLPGRIETAANESLIENGSENFLPLSEIKNSLL
jgi:hypothetical protein